LIEELEKYTNHGILLLYLLLFFTYYYDIFYKDLGTGYKKIIPDNIGELLTPVSLCYWIMSDGYKRNKGEYV
jgi:hypothetical protein